jgi:hypothetical protein
MIGGALDLRSCGGLGALFRRSPAAAISSSASAPLRRWRLGFSRRDVLALVPRRDASLSPVSE